MESWSDGKKGKARLEANDSLRHLRLGKVQVRVGSPYLRLTCLSSPLFHKNGSCPWWDDEGTTSRFIPSLLYHEIRKRPLKDRMQF